jgi:hypothetical protein
MEPEGSAPHSQAHATCPYPEPAPSSPHTHIPPPKDPSDYYPPIYAWVSPVVSFLQVSLPKPCTHLSPPPYALHAPPISIFLILSPAQYWVRSTDYSAPHYAPVEIKGSNPTRGMHVFLLCRQKEVSEISWSLVQSSPTECGASLCVI